MFLGDTLQVPDEDILMILPWEPLDKESRRAIQPAGRRVRRAARAAQKTYIITERDGRFAIYASAISASRLVMRNETEAGAVQKKSARSDPRKK